MVSQQQKTGVVDKVFYYLFMLLIFYLSLHSPSMMAATGTKPVILIMGDSLSAAYKIPSNQSWPQLLQARLNNNSHSHTIVNLSISGETTKGGLKRLPAALDKYQPAIVILELGGNDGLRGSPLLIIKKNLRKMIKLIETAQSRLLLVGVKLPPNYGKPYTSGFTSIYQSLSKEFNCPLVPFLLEGFATDNQYMQSDRIHPTAAAQSLILNNLWPHLTGLLN